MNSAYCYYCGLPSTGDEHVPPKCLFPAQKDSLGINYRENLWTVPSCDEHNLRKSKDDEFLMLCLTPIVGNNFAAFVQTNTKLHRAFARKDKLLGTILQNIEKAKISANQGLEFPVLIGKANTPRLIRVLENVARGLYFHNKGERFIGKCHIVPGFVKYANEETENFKLNALRMVYQEKSEWKKYGKNPEIFYYEIGNPDSFELTPLLMTFFGYAEAFVVFQPHGINLLYNEA